LPLPQLKEYLLWDGGGKLTLAWLTGTIALPVAYRRDVTAVMRYCFSSISKSIRLFSLLMPQSLLFSLLLCVPLIVCSHLHASELMVIAHRGGVVDEKRSENSILALEEAIKRGYTHVEVDARMTADGHVVCFHNDSLLEEAGVDGKIFELNLSEVTKIVLPRSEEKIPTFDDYCRRCVGRIGVMVDLKGCPERYVERYAREIETSLKRHGLLQDALILINKEPINNQGKVIGHLRGKAKISWRKTLKETQRAAREIPRFAEHFYIFNHGADFSTEDVKGFQALGLKVIVSINTQHYQVEDSISLGTQHIQTMMRFGVDGLQIDSVYDGGVFRVGNLK
jgi:glycerophosphoryl diester phosphodiesterase